MRAYASVSLCARANQPDWLTKVIKIVFQVLFLLTSFYFNNERGGEVKTPDHQFCDGAETGYKEEGKTKEQEENVVCILHVYHFQAFSPSQLVFPQVYKKS